MSIKTEIKISGMSCEHCVARVEKSLENLEGVEEVQVDIKTEKATVKYDPEKLKIAELDAAVEKAGYNVVK
jgi:copper ion binding protein